MKFIYLILALAVLLLALNPGINSISLQQEVLSGCCSKQCAGTNEELPRQDKNHGHSKGNDCNGKTCNPFLFCGSCVLIYPVLRYNYQPALTSSEIIIFSYSQNIVSSFSSDFWHPPKIV